MNEVKVWWQSRIIWAQIIGILFAVASTLKWDLGEMLGLSQEELLAGVMTVIGVASIILRRRATEVIASSAEVKEANAEQAYLLSQPVPKATRRQTKPGDPPPIGSGGRPRPNRR